MIPCQSEVVRRATSSTADCNAVAGYTCNWDGTRGHGSWITATMDAVKGLLESESSVHLRLGQSDVPYVSGTDVVRIIAD